MNLWIFDSMPLVAELAKKDINAETGFQQQSVIASCSRFSDSTTLNSREELRALGSLCLCYNKPLVAWSLHKVKQKVVPVSA